MSAELLFNAEDIPFNLAGEQIDNGPTEEGEKRVRALAESEARKAQQAFPSLLQSAEDARRKDTPSVYCQVCKMNVWKTRVEHHRTWCNPRLSAL